MAEIESYKFHQHLYLISTGARTYQLLLLNKLDVSERFRRQFNCLIKTVLTSVGHVDDLYDFCLQPLQRK